MAKTPVSDFDASTFVKYVDIKSIEDRVEALEKKVISHEAFADTFCNVHARDVNVRKEITKNMSDFIKTDSDFQSDLSVLIRKIDRGYFNSFLGKLGFAVWSILLIIISALATNMVNNHIGSSAQSLPQTQEDSRSKR